MEIILTDIEHIKNFADCFYIGNYHKRLKLTISQVKAWLNNFVQTGYAGQIILGANGEVIDGWKRLSLMALWLAANNKADIMPNIDNEEVVAYKQGYVQMPRSLHLIYDYCQTIPVKLDVQLSVCQVKDIENSASIYKSTNMFQSIHNQRDTDKYNYQTQGEFKTFLYWYGVYKTGKPNVNISDLVIDKYDMERHLGYYLDYQQKDLYKICREDHYLLPMLFELYNIFDRRGCTRQDFDTAYSIITAYEVRRQVAQMPAYPAKVRQWNGSPIDKFIKNLNYVDTEVFKDILETKPLYPENRQIVKFLLEKIESLQGMANIDMSNLTIEHIMPQEREPYWVKISQEDHKAHVHRLGNLTLTAVNSQLSNKAFDEKREMIEWYSINKEIHENLNWNCETINRRGRRLAKIILELYSPELMEKHKVQQKIDTSTYEIPKGTAWTGLKPTGYEYKGVFKPCTSWAQLEYQLYEDLIRDYPVLFMHLPDEMPNNFSMDSRNNYKFFKQLSNEVYYRTNKSAESIRNLIREVLHFFCLEEDVVKIKASRN